MKLSEFIYQGAIEGSNYGDASMTYESFLMGNMAMTEDYSGYLEKAYHIANWFLQRCSALGKIPCRIKGFYERSAECQPATDDGAPGLPMGDDFLKPVAVFQYDDDEKRQAYANLPFRKLGNKVFVLGPYSPYRKIYVQYRIKVPLFSKNDIVWVYENTTTDYSISGSTESFLTVDEALEAAEEEQIDLTEAYGIDDNLLMIGIDFMRARLNDDVSLGHSQEVEAESRLNDFDTDEFIYAQVSGGRVAL